MTTAIEVSGVSKRFRLYRERPSSVKQRLLVTRSKAEDFWALRDVSATVEEGSTLGLIGHNGSGKTTLLKCIAGILRPSEGTIRTRGRMAALLELGAGFHPELTGRENVYLNAAFLGLSRRETARVYDDIVIACTKDRGASWVTSEQAISTIVQIGGELRRVDRQISIQRSGTSWLIDPLGVQRASDADLSWSEPLPPRPIVDALDRDHVFLAVGRTLLGSSDAGASFQPVASSLDRRVASIAFQDPEHGFAANTDLSAQQTSDGGRTWREATLPLAFAFSCRRLASCIVISDLVARTSPAGRARRGDGDASWRPTCEAAPGDARPLRRAAVIEPDDPGA